MVTSIMLRLREDRQTNGRLVISNYEICTWLAGQGVAKTLGHNLGGGSQHPFGRVQLTIAHHSSKLPDGSYGGNPSGFLLSLAAEKLRVYFACDTALFYDMKLIGAVGLDLAVLPIGDLFTMGPDDAFGAVNYCTRSTSCRRTTIPGRRLPRTRRHGSSA